MKKLFLISFMCFLAHVSFCQTSDVQRKKQLENDPKLQEFLKRHDEITKNNQSQVTQTSVYYGYEETLKTYFVGNAIPAETPKAEAGLSKSGYVKILNEWISKNKNLLKSEHKNSLITE